MGRPHAFTLIELLVVVTIIVVLLALLTPALDKAIYSAELAACGANLKTQGTSLQQFAFDHQRRYPEHIANTPYTGTPMFSIATEQVADLRSRAISTSNNGWTR